LEAIGVLAGGIAHDFNNILSAIMGYGELAHMAAREDSVERRHLEEIIHAGARARDLVKQILTFGRQHSAEVQAANLQPIVKEAMKLLRASLPTTIEFRASIPDDCGPALVDPTQFHQAVVNLCTNAGYAMREAGGVLEVDLRECEVDAALAARLGVAGPGRFLRLTVSDTGAGMSKETLDRAFEPFFTTKPEGEGTGLGLATVHGIVTGVGGGISVYSEPGHGTTFQVYVPLAQEPAEGGTHIEDTAAGGTEYVMVVDDEPTVAAMASESLRALGYSVDVFIDSQQALGAFSDEPDRYDLVLTDQTMPNLTGDQLVASMRFLRPDLPAVIATGFQPRIEQGLLSHSASPKVLSKPFSVGDLARAVRGALDEARQ
jgi:CheY-like chemotaxis protein